MSHEILRPDDSTYVMHCPQLKVYLASSLTAPDDTGLRTDLLDAAANLFSQHGFITYSPSDFTPPGSPHLDHEVFVIDYLAAAAADLVFFIRIQPSHGMGIEAQIAADYLIPWSDAKLAERDWHLTPLVAGLPNAGTGVRFHFDSVTDFCTKLRSRLADGTMQERARAVASERRACCEIIRRLDLGRKIHRQRLILDLSIDELADRVNIASFWIGGLERDESFSPGLSIVQVMRLLHETRLCFDGPTQDGTLEFPSLVPIDQFEPKLVSAAEKYGNYALANRKPGEPLPDSDDKSRERWRKWLYTETGLSLPTISQKTSDHLPDRLSAMVAMPISNLNSNQEAHRDTVIREVIEALNSTPKVSFSIELPKFQRTNRGDHGPEIYTRSLRQLGGSDLGIIIGSPTATGVGIMLKLFANATVPCLVLVEKTSCASRMFKGMIQNGFARIIEYDSVSKVRSVISEAMQQYVADVSRSAARRRPIRNRILESSMRRSVNAFRIPRACRMDDCENEMRRKPYIRSDFFRELAENDSATPFVSLLQFVQIARSMNWGISVRPNGVPHLHPTLPNTTGLTDRQRRAACASLDNLLEARRLATLRSLLPIDDDIVFREWEKFLHELTLDAADFESSRFERSTEQWIDVLLDNGKL